MNALKTVPPMLLVPLALFGVLAAVFLVALRTGEPSRLPSVKPGSDWLAPVRIKKDSLSHGERMARSDG